MSSTANLEIIGKVDYTAAMAPPRRIVWIPALCLIAAAGCTTAERVGREALRSSPKGREILNDFDRYAPLAKVLMKYHDKGNLDEGDVLDVLYAAGVVKKIPAPGRPGGSKTAPKRSAAKAFPVPKYRGSWVWPLEAGLVSSEFGPRSVLPKSRF